jgi:LPXTG-motif cell wall-anchored protein
MKKTITALLCAALLLSILPRSALASPGDTYDDGYYSYVELAEGLLSITDYHGSYDNITLPSSYKGMTVTQVANSAFYDERVVRIVTLPDTISTVGEHAFDNDIIGSISQVNLNDGLLAIRGYAFARTGFRELVLPDSVKIMDDHAFTKCQNLKSVTIGKGLTGISREAFSYCPSLAEVTIPSNVTAIGVDAFRGCSSLKSVHLSEGLQTIDVSAFKESGLSSIELPDTLKNIEKLAFANTNLTSITIPKSVTKVQEGAFADCHSLSKAIILGKDTALAGSCFYITNLVADGIYGIPGSTAEAYADDNNIPFHEYVPEPLPDEASSWPATSVTVGTDTLYTGGRTILTPEVPGGKWFYDENMVSITQNADGTYALKALRAGEVNLHYTIGWADVDIPLTIYESVLPETGQDFTWVWAAAALAAAVLSGGLALRKKHKKA